LFIITLNGPFIHHWSGIGDISVVVSSASGTDAADAPDPAGSAVRGAGLLALLLLQPTNDIHLIWLTTIPHSTNDFSPFTWVGHATSRMLYNTAYTLVSSALAAWLPVALLSFDCCLAATEQQHVLIAR
jgi:hypothetical protein